MKKTFTNLSVVFLAFVMAFSCCAAIFASAEGEPAFGEGAVFVFDVKAVNGVIEGEDCVICTTQEAYDACGPDWSVTILLQEQEDGKFLVVRPPYTAYGDVPELTVGDGTIALVVHSAAWDLSMAEEYPNVEAKLAAEAVRVGMCFMLDGIDLAEGTGSGRAALYQGQLGNSRVPTEGVNVARGAKYVTSDLFRQDDSFFWSPNEPVAYPDTDGVELTDGVFPSGEPTHYDPAYFGFRADSPDYVARGYAYIRVDLGKVYDLSALVLYVGTVRLNNGIFAPESVTFYAVGDMDGSDPVEIGTVYPYDDVTALYIPCVLEADVSAQFIEIRITERNWLFVTEFEAYASDAGNPVLALGDLNGNGKIDSTDYLMLKRYCLDTFALTEEQIAAADVNRDGRVNALDYMMVKRAAMGTFVIG